MLSPLLPPVLLALLMGGLIVATTAGACALFLPFVAIKLLVPVPGVRRACTDVMFAIARQWARLNALLYRIACPVNFHVDLRGTLDPARSYLLVCNHQSWLDILLLYDQLRERVPPLCFFLKRELLWVPGIGAACWALDFPFMRRRSREELARNPALAGEDLAATRLFCERYRGRPVTVVNFAEGTRYSESKRDRLGSPYRHLLRPKSAGLSFTLGAMGTQFAGVIDATIAYRPSRHSPLWSFLRGEQTDVAIHFDVQPVPQDLLSGDYSGDPQYRERFQAWVNALWARKDARLDRLINATGAGGRAPASA